MTTTTGIGWDSHRLAAGRPLILGGIAIAHELGLDGHSDADVLTHAVIDALLGAAAMGDIGQHFPDTDPRFKDADSLDLLRTVVTYLDGRGYALGNVDATVICEAPKLGPYRDDMRRRLAGTVGLSARDVNVKFTTNEGMGAIGRGEGIAAMAVATVDRTSPD